MTDQQIFKQFTDWLATNFPTDMRTDWYVGIASDIQQRLFGDHNVHRQNHVWIHGQAVNADHARSAERMLLNTGYDGGGGGGDHATTYVYAFRKDPGTVR